MKSGELKYREDIVDGLDRAPEAFIGLLQGRNFGKLVVKLGDDPTREVEAWRRGDRDAPDLDPDDGDGLGLRRLSAAARMLCGLRNPACQRTAAAAQPACSSYTVPVTVGGQPQQAVVEACQQPDGSWRITQTTPGLPPQVYEVPAPASPYPSAYPIPKPIPIPISFLIGVGRLGRAGRPGILGLAPSIVVVQRFNHFHHGFRHGFGHGFAPGFRPWRRPSGFDRWPLRAGGMAGGRR